MIPQRWIMAARACLLALTLPLLLGTTAAQAQSTNVIAAAAVNPNTASTGTARQVLVTASIPSDNYIAGSALVQRLDAAGRVLAVLGAMRDDGLEGDATAGDRVLTLRTTVLENTPGQVSYRVSAAFKGAALRVLSAPLNVSVSGVPTGVNISAPGNGAYINTPAITVSGSAGDNGARVVVNGVSAVVSGNRFTASLPLNEGPNTLTAVATNSNGTTSTHSIVVTLDTTAPRVEVYTPLVNAVTTAEQVTVAGLVNDIVVGTVNAEQARVTVNGVVAEVSNRSFVARNVPLALGGNTLAAVAEDRAGNRATASLTVQRLPSAGRANLAILSGDGQAGPVGRALASPLAVKLTDATGAPQVNQPVVFRVRTLDGALSTAKDAPGRDTIAVTTNTSGVAQAWLTLGSRSGAGNNLIQASATGVPGTADFVASGRPGAPALMVVDSGNNQYGVIGQPLPLPFIAIVTDAMNNRLANTPVTLAVTQGGGSFPTAAGNKTSIVTTSDGDGRVAATLTLGAQEGIYNNVVEANFPNSPGYAAAFMASGLAPAPAELTRITGVVLDNSNQPLQGVTMRLLQINQGNRSNLPQQVADPVVTDAQGQFTMPGVPVGVFKLMADGGTAQRPGTWPTLEFDMVTVSGQNNTVGMPIFLPEVLPQNRLCVSENTGGTLTVPEVPGFALTIKPGSATFPGGSRAGCVSVTPVHMDKSPMSPGFGQQPRFLVTIQPVGTHFNPPAQMSMPNVDGLLPGMVTEMYSYDHDLAAFVAIGSATVSRDGSVISSDPGVGVMKAGWHCGGNPNSSGSAGSCPECQKCQGSACAADASQNGHKSADDQCKECKNGALQDIPLSKTATTVTQKVGIPNEATKKFTDGFKALEKLSITVKAELSQELSLSISENDCCGKTTGISKKSTGKVSGNFGSISVEGRIWPPPGPPFVDYDSGDLSFGLLKVQIKAKLNGGVFLSGAATVSGEVGYRKDGCSDDAADRDGCFFAGLSTTITPAVEAKIAGNVSAATCIFDCDNKTNFKASASFGGKAALPINISKVTYNQPKCSSGLDGGLFTIDPLTFKVTAKFSVSYDIAGNSSGFDFSKDLMSCKITLSEAGCDF